MSKYKDEWPKSERSPEPSGFLLLGTAPRPGTVGFCMACQRAVRYGPYFYRRMVRHARKHAREI